MNETSEQVQNTAERLKTLGLIAAASKVNAVEKMQKAYGNYMFVTKEKVAAFNEKLKEDSFEDDGRLMQYKQLVFIPLKDYTEVPPIHVLDALEKAKIDDCFDEFEVAKIDWIRQVKDPIIFGVINSCDDKFFITQWDDDVKIEDIMFMNLNGKK